MELVMDMSLEIEGYDELVKEDEIRDYVKKALESEFESDRPVYLSLLFTGNDEIQVINRDYRGKDQPTDVISFAYHETEDFDIGPYDTLGDIVISMERVEEQAAEYNHSVKRELYYVLTHGLLHLLGYDHIEEEDRKEMRIREEEIKDYVKKALESEFESDRPVYLSLLFTGNDEIQVINRDYRGKDQPTDVISFAYHETEDFDIGPYDTLGDIVISMERVEKQAAEYNHSVKRELYYVLTHGLLHLLGYDHIEEEDRKEMRIREEEILGQFGYTREMWCYEKKIGKKRELQRVLM